MFSKNKKENQNQKGGKKKHTHTSKKIASQPEKVKNKIVNILETVKDFPKQWVLI